MEQTKAADLLSRILDEVEADGASATGAEASRPAPAPPSADLLSLLPTLLSALPQGGGTSAGAKHPTDRHTALLCAVKPYLGERRQATAETVIRLCRLWDALSRAGLSTAVLNGLLGGSAPSGKESGSGERREVD